MYSNRMNFRERPAKGIFYEATRALKIGIILVAVAFLLGYCHPAHAANVKLVISITECESGGKYDAVGDHGKSVGIVQFQKATFNELKAKADMPKLQWKNPIHQLRLMNWAIDHGYGKRWTCYRMIHPDKVKIGLGERTLFDAENNPPARKEDDYSGIVKDNYDQNLKLKTDYNEMVNNL